MGNYDEKVVKPLSKVTGPLIGQVLLPAVKRAMLEQKVFRLLFGKNGEQIFDKNLPNYNDTIVPLIEFQWKGERWQSQNTRINGIIGGMIVLPADLLGHTDRFRAIAATFARWIESNNGLFEVVPGLIEFGSNIDFKYDGAIQAGGSMFPMIAFTLPVVFDLALFQAQNQDVDLDGDLDAELIGWIETYKIRIKDEKSNVLIDTQTLSITEQEQDG